MQKKKILKKLVIIFLLIISMIFSFCQFPIIADYGDFESYDSGSDSWDSSYDSSWDSSYDSSYDSSWSSDHDRDSSYSSGGFYIGGGLGIFILFMVISIIILYYNKRDPNNRINSKPNPGYRNMCNSFSSIDQKAIEKNIQTTDPLFSKNEFLSWASDLFIKLQYAWSDRDLEIIRKFETPELYEQTKAQVDRYIQEKRINKIERVSVNNAKLYKFERQSDREVLSVMIQSKMIDYIIDEETQKILQGNNYTNRINTYILTFVRSSGAKTRSDGSKTETMNCPNCGAPTEITSSGKCSYCGSVIVTDHHGWSLASLKKYNQNM